MKAVRLTLAGRERHLAYTVEAMFQLEELFGEVPALIDAVSADDREGFQAACRAAAVLAEQGELGVVGLVTALTVLTAQCEDAGAEAKALTKSLKESQTAYEELSASMEEERSSVSASIRALEDLLAAEDKSAAQKDVIRRKVEELNEKVPGLSLAYDEAADAINMTGDALERMAESAGMQEEYAAQVERLNELYTERQALEEELAETKEHLAEAMADAQWDSFGGAMNDSAAAAGQLQEAEAALNAALEEHAGRIAELEGSTAALSEQQTAAAEQTREMTIKTEDMTARMESAIQEVEALQSAYEESYASALENIYGQVGLFQEMDGAAKTSVDSLIDTLKGQVSYMETYADNIQKAIEMGVDQGLVQQLSDGSEKSAQILASIVEGGKEDIEELNAQFAKVEKGKRDFAENVAEMETDFKKKMESLVDDLDKAIQDMDLKDDAYKIGVNNMKGLIDGTASQKRALVEKYTEMGNASLAAYKRAVHQASPSKDFQIAGQFDIQGLIQGAAGMKEKLTNIYITIAKAAKKGMEENLPSFQLKAGSISYDPSVDYAALMQKARSRAEFDALAAQREAKIAGEKIDLAEKGYADNAQLLEQWEVAMAQAEMKSGETVSAMTETAANKMNDLVDGAPNIGRKFINGIIDGITALKEKLGKTCAEAAKSAEDSMAQDNPNIPASYDSSTDYAALMQEARSRAEFDALAAQREAKIAGEKIDLTEKMFADNTQLLEQWKEAMAESEAKAQETLSFIAGQVDSEMRQLIDSAPGMGQDFVGGLIEGIERRSDALNRSVQRMTRDMRACIDAEFQPVQKQLTDFLTDWADRASATYRKEQLADTLDLAAALREALSGITVNMNQRKVGELVTDWQKNNDRSRGV